MNGGRGGGLELESSAHDASQLPVLEKKKLKLELSECAFAESWKVIQQTREQRKGSPTPGESGMSADSSSEDTGAGAKHRQLSASWKSSTLRRERASSGFWPAAAGSAGSRTS